MRIAKINGRAALVVDQGSYVDVGHASEGRFSSDVMELFGSWTELKAWAQQVDSGSASPFEPGQLDCPVAGARQIFAVGLNYAEHVREAGVTAPPEPAVFTKFASSLSAPYSTVALPEGNVDWEAELVAVVGRGGREIPVREAWDHVAAVSVGQDLSERRLQRLGDLPQFSLAKSFAGFSPVGPYLVTPDELRDRDDLAIGCSLNGEEVQKARTSQLLFSIPELVSRLSRVVELLPGDVIFTGTPPGVGVARSPQRFIQAGDELITHVEGVGELHQTFVSARSDRAVS